MKGEIFMDDNNYLTLKEAAHYLHVNERTMKNILIRNEDNVSYIKISGRYIIDKAVLINLMNSKSFKY